MARRNIIIAAVSLIVVLIIAAVLILQFVVFRTNRGEPVPDKYKNNWDESLAFNTEDCREIFIPENEKLRVLQLTDIHYDMNNNRKEETLELIRNVINEANPHIIALTGDWTSQRSDTLSHAKTVFDLIDSFNIPWAPVFGNHDMEGDLKRYDYADIFQGYKNCLFKVGYTNIGGVGNYIINVFKDSRDNYLTSIFMMDSNTSTRINIQEYIGLDRKQVEWYKWAVKGLNKNFAKDGETIPSLMYMHVPLNEYTELAEDGHITGVNDEKCCVPEKNTGMFDAIKEAGSTKAVFCGHDHMNNAVYEYEGVLLGYGIESGWCKGYAEESKKGGTLVTFGDDNSIKIDEILYSYSK